MEELGEGVVMGRPSKVNEWRTSDGLLKIKGMARDGLTREEIAKKIGIHRDTLNEWCKKFPDFSDALKEGSEIVDTEVEDALLKRALGYDYIETTIEETASGRRKKVYKRHMPPDTTAAIFWLKNRKPDSWRFKEKLPQDEFSEDDGLLAALSASVDEDMEDDSDFLPEDE